MAESCMAILFTQLISGSWQFLKATISQGSVAMRLRCGGKFNYFVTRNLL